MNDKILITVLGWEDRFVYGLDYNLKAYGFTHCLLFCYSEYKETTQANLILTKDFCNSHNIKLTLAFLENENAILNWKEIETAIQIAVQKDVQAILDISTTPRETLWTSLFFLLRTTKTIPFIYHKPQSYSEDWLSREPENPRLLFKHSGIIKFEKPTLLFLFTGFDTERIKQLVDFYDPRKIIFLIQEGDQFNNAIRNNSENLKGVDILDVEIYPSDCYDLEMCYSSIKKVLDRYIDDYNIVATSLGPKISGLALYKYYFENPSIALSYVPCKQYNIDYSKGWGGAISGELSL